MLHLGILKTWNATTYKAGVQLVGSLTTYLDNIAVATNIAASAMVAGNYVLVAIPEGNPRDACVVASWPAGSSGGGGGGTKIQDADGDTSWDVEQTADEDKVHGKVKGVEGFLLDDAGVLTLAKQSAARAYAGGAQIIPSGSWTQIDFVTASFDIQSEFDLPNNKFVATKAGIYFITAYFYFAAAQVTAGFSYGIRLYLNGATLKSSWLQSSIAAPMGSSVDEIIQLAVNDEITASVYQNRGSNATLSGGSGYTSMAIVKIA